MKSAEIRHSFINYFKDKDHRVVTSAPVIPHGDPTLMFTNAGMNQFKDVFLGTGKRDYVRAVNAQKCIRVSGKHNDLEQVGRDSYHHTFFEMLGNWSFADYYKKEAIEWAWELLTSVWKLPEDRLWATVFRDDDEAAALWPQVTAIDASRVLRFDEADNFWEMGEVGPCGPCSEIHIDRGPDFCDSREPGHVCAINGGCARYIELWNLVFIQYNKDKDGRLSELPAKHVDTGAGFERLVAVLQGRRSNYDSDLFIPLINGIEELTGRAYHSGDEEGDVAFRVISDHIRALSFAIADGALPSNEDRGYVLRRLLRRGARFGRVLGMHDPFIYKLVAPLVDILGDAYPELKERHQHIARVIKAEEEGFSRTLDRGLALFEEKSERIIGTQRQIFPGEDAFLLHDTYGFPLDLTQLMAREKGLEVDVAAFESAMRDQRQRSRRGISETGPLFEIPEQNGRITEFVGYDADEIESEVIYCDADKCVITKTPFYAEAGGQVSDIGEIVSGDNRFQVEHAQHIGDFVVHTGHFVKGRALAPGSPVIAQINSERRRAVERNHTATHLLHKALRTVLGDHVQQAGSLVHPDYLRFDFTHFEKVAVDDLERIEDIVNETIRINYPVRWEILPLDEARRRGAMALFGEKYEERVRMLEVNDYSRELCGGTHVDATGDIGYFYLNTESAVAAGVRRIEAFTGERAVEAARRDRRLVLEAASLLGCPPQETGKRIERLLEERKQLSAEVKSRKGRDARGEVKHLIASAHAVAGIRYVAARVAVSSLEELKGYGDFLREMLPDGVGLLFAEIDGKGTFLCVSGVDIVKSGRLHAGTIVREVAKITGSSGGGSPHMAQAGAKELVKVDEALAGLPGIISAQLT